MNDKKKDKEFALLRKHADAFAKCSQDLCRAEEEADKKIQEKLDWTKNRQQILKSRERVAMLKCRYNNCRESAMLVLKDVLDSYRDIPSFKSDIYKRGQALLRKKNATADDYVKFMTSINS